MGISKLHLSQIQQTSTRRRKEIFKKEKQLSNGSNLKQNNNKSVHDIKGDFKKKLKLKISNEMMLVDTFCINFVMLLLLFWYGLCVPKFQWVKHSPLISQHRKTDHADSQIFLLWTVMQLDQSRRWWIDLSDSQSLKGRVERIFFFASFKLPLFNEYEMVFIIA